MRTAYNESLARRYSNANFDLISSQTETNKPTKQKLIKAHDYIESKKSMKLNEHKKLNAIKAKESNKLLKKEAELANKINNKTQNIINNLKK